MNNDPIVSEVRRIRDDLARGFQYDIHAIFTNLRSREIVADPAHELVKYADGNDLILEGQSVLREEPPETKAE